MTKTHRIFDTGATRDSNQGKLEYSNYIHPFADYSFAEYMKSKQLIGWEYRRWDNRQKGIPPESLLESLVRHIEILKLLTKGYTVVETQGTAWTKMYVYKWDDKIVWDHKDMISELNAIRFNAEALKLYYLTKEDED